MLLEGIGVLLDRQAQRHEIICQSFLKKRTEGISKWYFQLRLLLPQKYKIGIGAATVLKKFSKINMPCQMDVHGITVKTLDFNSSNETGREFFQKSSFVSMVEFVRVFQEI
jgi:hypothetical protein